MPRGKGELRIARPADEHRAGLELQLDAHEVVERLSVTALESKTTGRNGLISMDGSLTPQPSLTEEFTTKGAKTWMFKLRKGVTFHDGNRSGKDAHAGDVELGPVHR